MDSSKMKWINIRLSLLYLMIFRIQGNEIRGLSRVWKYTILSWFVGDYHCPVNTCIFSSLPCSNIFVLYTGREGNQWSINICSNVSTAIIIFSLATIKYKKYYNLLTRPAQSYHVKTIIWVANGIKYIIQFIRRHQKAWLLLHSIPYA